MEKRNQHYQKRTTEADANPDLAKIIESEINDEKLFHICEKYAPVEGIDKYNPMFDPSVTGAVITPHVAEN